MTVYTVTILPCLFWICTIPFFKIVFQPNSHDVPSSGSGCCLSACPMCVNPSRPPGALRLLTSWWVTDLRSAAGRNSIVSYADTHCMSSSLCLLFCCTLGNVVCYTLCLLRDSECKRLRQVPHFGLICVCVCVCVCVSVSFVVFSVVPWFSFGAFTVWQYRLWSGEMIQTDYRMFCFSAGLSSGSD